MARSAIAKGSLLVTCLTSLSLQSFGERQSIGRRTEQQNGVIGRRDTVTHDKRIVIDVLASRALLGHCRRDRQRPHLQLLAVPRPCDRWIVFRVAWLADG